MESRKNPKTAAGEVSDAETLQDMTKEELIGTVLDTKSRIEARDGDIVQYKGTIANYNDGVVNLNLKCGEYERKIEEQDDRINRYVIIISNLQADCTVHEQRNDELAKQLYDMTDNRNENRSEKWDAQSKSTALNLRIEGLAEALRIISVGLKQS